MYEGKDEKNFERCHEYCDGNIAIFYCPQCWTNYCQECYDKEHSLKKRKVVHDKIQKTRETCLKHNLTLEYKSNDSFACCMCIKEMSSKELSTSVVEPIDGVATVMKTQLEDKIIELSTLSHKIQTKLKSCDDAVNKSISNAKNEVQRFFKALNILLTRQESSFQQQLNNLLQQTLNETCLLQMKDLMNKCNEMSEEVRLLLNGDSVVIAKDFQEISGKLNELVKNETVLNFEVPTLNVSVNVHRHLLEMAKHPGYIISNNIKVEKTQRCSLKEEIETNNEVIQQPCCSPQQNMVNFIPSFSSSTSSQISLPSELPELRPLPVNSVDDEDLCCCSENEIDSGVIGFDNKSSPKPPRCSSVKRKHDNKDSLLLNYRKTRRQETSKDLCRCDSLLTELWATDVSFPFVRAVDAKKIPEYYEIVKKPMNLSMIKTNLQSLAYDCVYDFVADMKLMFKNCFKFNLQGSDIYEKGKELEEIFIKLLRKEFPDIHY